MDREDELEETEERGKPGRGWTERLSGPVQFRRFTDTDVRGRAYIYYQLGLLPGEKDPPKAVYDVFDELKELRPSPRHGMRPQPTGLKFVRDEKHGRLWRLPDTPIGRTAADIIDAKLLDLAQSMDSERGRG